MKGFVEFWGLFERDFYNIFYEFVGFVAGGLAVYARVFHGFNGFVEGVDVKPDLLENPNRLFALYGLFAEQLGNKLVGLRCV